MTAVLSYAMPGTLHGEFWPSKSVVLAAQNATSAALLLPTAEHFLTVQPGASEPLSRQKFDTTVAFAEVLHALLTQVRQKAVS